MLIPRPYPQPQPCRIRYWALGGEHGLLSPTVSLSWWAGGLCGDIASTFQRSWRASPRNSTLDARYDSSSRSLFVTSQIHAGRPQLASQTEQNRLSGELRLQDGTLYRAAELDKAGG